LALNVRKIWAYDLEQVVNLVREMSDESEIYTRRGFNLERTTNLVSCFCLGFQGFIAYVTENEAGEVVGMIGLFVMDSLTHSVRTAQDVGVFLRPEYRGTSAAIRMIKAAEKEALEYGVDEIHLGISTGVMPEKTVHIYKKLGYKMASYGMIKEIL